MVSRTEMNHPHLQGSSPNTWPRILCTLTPPLSLFPDCLDFSAASPHLPAIVHDPWLILPISLFKVFADFRHLYSQLSQWYLWLVLEGLQGADKCECRLFASIYNMQKRFSTSVDGISACSGSFVLVTFSQLNENPPQRLMQPEAIRDVQTHLLSSLGDLPAILQSWQDGNKGSGTQIAVRASFMRKRACSLIRYPIFLWLCWDISAPRPSPSFQGPSLCRKTGVFLYSTTCSSNLSRSLQAPRLCAPRSPPLSAGSLPCCSTVSLQHLQLSVFRALHQKVTSSSGGTMHQEILDPTACFHLIGFHCAGNVISAPLLSFIFPLANHR